MSEFDNNSQFNRSSQDENLRKLNSQLNRNDDDDDRKGAVGGFFKKLIIIILILILLGGIGVAVYFFTKSPGNISQGGIIKLSTLVTENLTDESGDQSISDLEVFPGEKYNIRCVVSNSDSTSGDDTPSEYANIFVRYTITVDVDGRSYNNVVIPIMSDLSKESWHIYNPEEEIDGYVWDGYYYYYGSLAKNQRLTLFEEIEFDFHNTLNMFGGKSATITINVEAVHADVENLGVESGNAWNTAPRKWITNMQRGVNNKGNSITV